MVSDKLILGQCSLAEAVGSLTAHYEILCLIMTKTAFEAEYVAS